MVKRLNYVLFGISCCLVGSVHAQPWQLNDSIAFPLPESVIGTSDGQLYVATPQGSIVQYNQLGDTINIYQPSGQEPPQLLRWQLLRLQAYFAFQQTLTILDQNLREVSSITLPETTLGNAVLSADQQVWYISTEGLLHKYNPFLTESTLTTSLQWHLTPQSDIRLVQEHQNRLYIQAGKRLLVFDLFGNFLLEIPLLTSDPVQFHENEVYFVSKGEIHFINLYSAAKRKHPLLLGKNIHKILWEKEYLHGFSERFWYKYLMVDRTQE